MKESDISKADKLRGMADLEFEDEDYSPSAAVGPQPVATTELVMTSAQTGQRIDQALAQLMPDVSRSRLAALIKDGLVLVDGARSTPKRKLNGMERVQVTMPARAEDQAYLPEQMPLTILFEDASVIVLDKPPGLVVHPAAGNWSGTLLNGLLQHDAALARVPRAGIVHRLDKDTSGLMVVARTEAAQFNLVQQLQARTVRREYVALVQGQVPRDGTVTAPLGRHPRARTKMAVVEGSRGKQAITHYSVTERMARHTLIECRLETGRTHQIRVHMQSIGFPLEGDVTYGARRCPPIVEAVARFKRQALHARRLAFQHPATQQLVSFEASVPADLEALIDAAREVAE